MSEQLSSIPDQINTGEGMQGEDLQDLQIHIMLATQNVRRHGEAHLPQLTQLLIELDQKIASTDGLFITGLPINGLRASNNDKKLETSYSLGVDNFDNPLLYIPNACITAHKSNPQFYAMGHATSPVLNLRVLRSPDQPAQDDRGRHIPDTEMWIQIPLDTVNLAVSYGSLAPVV